MKNIKVSTMVTKRNYVTQKENWNDDTLTVTFKACEYDPKKNRFIGDFEYSYKDFSVEVNIVTYEMGADLRSEAYTALREYLEIYAVVYGGLTVAQVAVRDVLISILPEYKRFM